MKNKRLALLLLGFLIITSIAVSAVIFDETKASGYYYGNYYGSGGFASGIGEFYTEFGGWADFFIFALIFGSLAKRVFKEKDADDTRHSNLIVIGLAIGLALMLVLYEERTGKRLLIDYWPVAAIMLFSVIAVLLWKFWYKVFEKKGGWWATAIAMVVTVFVFFSLFKELTDGGSTFWTDYFSNPMVNLPLTIPFILLILFFTWAFRKFSVPHLKNIMNSGATGSASSSASPSGSSRGGAGASPASRTLSPEEIMLSQRMRDISTYLSRYAKAFSVLSKYFRRTPTPDRIEAFINSLMNKNVKIDFPKGVKDKNIEQFIFYYVHIPIQTLFQLADTTKPTAFTSVLNPIQKKMFSDLSIALGKASDAFTSSIVGTDYFSGSISKRPGSYINVMQAMLNNYHASNDDLPFINYIWAPMEGVFINLENCIAQMASLMSHT